MCVKKVICLVKYREITENSLVQFAKERGMGEWIYIVVTAEVSLSCSKQSRRCVRPLWCSILYLLHL